MEKPDAEMTFQPTHGLAKPGGADAARTRAEAKTLGARHGDEGIQVTKIDLHCSLFRTACSDYSQ
jgi:hypothetical protein